MERKKKTERIISVSPPFSWPIGTAINQSINQSKNYTLWMDIGKWKTTQLNQKAGQKGFFPGTVDYRPLHNQQITPLEGQLKWIMSSLWPQ